MKTQRFWLDDSALPGQASNELIETPMKMTATIGRRAVQIKPLWGQRGTPAILTDVFIH